MRVAIRVDAATHIGIGHVMRCLILANALKMEGANVSFICRPFVGHLGERISAEGHRLIFLSPATQTITPPDPTQTPPHTTWLGESWEIDLAQTQAMLKGKTLDWLIVDHYSLDIRWESAMRDFTHNIMVVDDLDDRRHDCDLLLNQNLHDVKDSRYDRLISPECVRLLGLKYALLRPEFKEVRKNLRKRDGKIRQILIFFGGSDPSNETTKVLETLMFLKDSEVSIDVIVGHSNQKKEDVKNLCESMPRVKFYDQVINMAHLMLKADLAFGGSGVSTLERMAVGLPAGVISIAENQHPLAIDAAEAGAICYLGKSEEVSVEMIADFLKKLLANPTDLVSMSAKASTLIDGRGTERVIQSMLENS